MDRPRIRCLVSHPIQYQVPLFRLLAKEPDFDFGVWYARGPGEYYDDGFGQQVEWDQDLNSGYSWEVLSTREVWSRLTRKHLDALWLHGYGTIRHFLAGILAHRNGVKVWIRGESWLPREEKDPNPPPIYRGGSLKRPFVLPSFLKMVDVCLAIGLRNQQFYREYGVPESKIAWVPYAVDNEWWMSQQRPQYPGNFNRVLFVGKLQPWKRPQDVLAALPPNCMVAFVGDGPLKSKLSTANSILGGFVNLTGLAEWYNWADVVVVPSEFEPWGLVVNEAMCFGKPVVATHEVGCVPDLIHDDVTGYAVHACRDGETFTTSSLFDRPNMLIDDLRKRIEQAIQHKDRLGKAAFEHVQRYSYQEDIKGIRDALYKSFLYE